ERTLHLLRGRRRRGQDHAAASPGRLGRPGDRSGGGAHLRTRRHRAGPHAAPGAAARVGDRRPHRGAAVRRRPRPPRGLAGPPGAGAWCRGAHRPVPGLLGGLPGCGPGAVRRAGGGAVAVRHRPPAAGGDRAARPGSRAPAAASHRGPGPAGAGRRGVPHPHPAGVPGRSEEHTSELQSRFDLVCPPPPPPRSTLIPYTTLFRSAGRELSAEQVEELSLFATDHLLPEVTVLLDLDPAHLPQRLTEDPDRLERAGGEFHTRTRQAFLDRAARDPQRWLVLDAARGVADLAGAIRERVAPLLGVSPEEGRPAERAPGRTPDLRARGEGDR